MAKRCVYGPVPSRRLGLSLGVDLIAPPPGAASALHKVCCYDCSYCQVGPTSRLSVEREAFLDPDEVARQVEVALRERPGAELVTLAGSGEPTLYRELEALVAALRRVTSLPLALLTNGGMLWDDEVRRAALCFDLCAPSLDAADEETFAAVNRPHPALDFATMLEGLRAFCRSFRGTCRLEVMLVQGVNDSPSSLDALAALVGSLEVTSVDLNTVVRPPAHGARRLDDDALAAARDRIAAGCRHTVTRVAPFRDRERESAGPEPLPPEARQRLLETVARRPCTVHDLAAVLSLAPSAVRELCAAALADGALAAVEQSGQRYYRAAGS
jgi:wyosine [tRNA(Phe)-imidazoG37] synthetase (radical SAM superfamily)